jgi:hypothetical protein
MADEFGEGPGLEGRKIEDLVQNAMGESITPSRLLQSYFDDFVNRKLGVSEIPGPFTEPLDPNEQPHYLFTSSAGAIVDNVGSGGDKENLNSAVLMITDQRTFIFTSEGGVRETNSIPHEQLTGVDLENNIIWDKIVLEAGDTRYRFGPDDYSANLEDAIAYILNKSQFETKQSSFEFESGDFDAAKEALSDQLDQIQNLSGKIDIKGVISAATDGAYLGKRIGSTHGAVVGFILGAGHNIWSQFTDENEQATDLDNLDPDETANDILRWEKAGGETVNKGGGLAGAVLGAALSIDKQTSGGELSRQLADLDLDWVTRQLEAGNKQEVAVEVGKTAIEAYSSDISNLLSEGFFKELTGQ